MHLIQKLANQGIESFSEGEIKKLMHEVTFTQTNFGHLQPTLHAELASRRAAKTNKLTLYISILTLVVALATLIQGFVRR